MTRLFTSTSTGWTPGGRLATELRQPACGLPALIARWAANARGPRFAARNIVSQFRELVQKARGSQPEQHRHHHEVARAERSFEPVGIAQAGRKLDQSLADAVFDQRQALFGPGLVALREPGGHEFEDRRLHGV